MGYHCCHMDDTLWKLLPVLTGAAGYLGGILTEPLKKSVTDALKVRELRSGLIGEIVNAYEQYHFALMAGHNSSMFKSVQKAIRILLSSRPRNPISLAPD